MNTINIKEFYKQKYLKYKTKYLKYKTKNFNLQKGGVFSNDINNSNHKDVIDLYPYSIKSIGIGGVVAVSMWY
jgi:hypothetical protein